MSKSVTIQPSGGGVVPSFLAHKNGAGNPQSIVSNTITKVTWVATAFDTNSDFDFTTNHRYTPSQAGKYLFNFFGHLDAGATGTQLYSQIRKNGQTSADHIDLAYGPQKHASNAGGLGLSSISIFDMNGTTDYVEAWVWHSFGVATNLNGNISTTQFQGFRVGA